MSSLLPCCLSAPLPPIIRCSLFPLQVTHELLDKVGEVEANLKSHTQFQDRMDRLADWVVITHQTIVTRGLSPGQAQVDANISCSLSTEQEPAHLPSLCVLK